MASRGGIVAILFTDVVGSTTLYDTLGDEEAERLRRRHFALVRESVASFGGDEVKTAGDGFMVVFASAIAAVDCGVDILAAVSRDAGSGLDVRIGIHLGEPMEDDRDIFGLSVNVAKRLCDASAPGQLLVSDVVRALVASRGKHVFGEVGSLSLKGIADPVTAYEVTWQRASSEPAPMPAALAAADRAPLVGRTEEIAALGRAWDAVERTSSLGVVLVRGEPGVGKTRLVAAFARAVGSTVLFGRCEETAAAAYHAFADAIDGALRSLPLSIDDLRAALGSTAPHVAPLTPALADALAIEAAPMPDRRALLDGVCRFLAAIARARSAPLLLVLDDLHWADEATLALYQHVRHSLVDVPILVAGTYRDTDVDRTHPFAATLADLRRDDNVVRIDVRGLSQQDVVDLVAVDDDGRVAGAIHRETEGNPFFVGEIVRHLVEVGTLRAAADGRREVRAGTPLDHIDLPEGIREVIGRRLSRLSDETNRVLAVASVVGKTFRLPTLVAIVELTVDDVLDRVDEALGAKVLAEEPGAPDTFSFTHALIRHALYEELPTLRRLRLHERIGTWFGANGGAAQEVASHLLTALPAGDAVVAARAALDAARAAAAVAAYEEGLAFVTHGQHALEDAGGRPELELRTDLSLQQAELAFHAGDMAGATDATVRAAAGARALGDPSRLARAAITVGRSGRPVAPDERLDGLIAEALEREDLDPVDRARLLGMRQFRLGPTRGRWQASIDALDAARATGDPEAIGYSLVARIDALAGTPDLTEAFALAEEASAVIEETPRVATGVPAIAMRRMVLLLRAGDRAGADEYVEWTRKHTTRLRVLRDLPSAFEAMLALFAGELEAARTKATEAMSRGWTMPAFWAGATLVVACRELGRHEEAVGLLRAMTDLVAPDPVYVLLADGLAYEGGRGPCESSVRDDEFWVGRDGWPVEYPAMVAEAAALLGRAALLAVAADRLRPFSGQWACGPGVPLGPADHYLGLAALAQGDADEAVARLEASIAQAAAFPSPLWTTIGELELSSALHVRGDAMGAAEMRERARTRAESLGFARLARRAAGPLR